jgi:hypothetical protein
MRRLCGVIGRILDRRIGAAGQRVESGPTLFICEPRARRNNSHEFGSNVEITSINTARSGIQVELQIRRR